MAITRMVLAQIALAQSVRVVRRDESSLWKGQIIGPEGRPIAETSTVYPDATKAHNMADRIVEQARLYMETPVKVVAVKGLFRTRVEIQEIDGRKRGKGGTEESSGGEAVDLKPSIEPGSEAPSVENNPERGVARRPRAPGSGRAPVERPGD